MLVHYESELPLNASKWMIHYWIQLFFSRFIVIISDVFIGFYIASVMKSTWLIIDYYCAYI